MKTSTHIYIWPVVVFVGAVVVLTLMFVGRTDDEKKHVAKNTDFDRVANIALNDYTSNTVTLEKYRGRPLIINVWAVWCPFCRQELPDFVTLQAELGDEVVVVAIDRAETLEEVKGFTDELGISDALVFLIDRDDRFYKISGGFTMPETLFLAGDGTIAVHKRGFMTLDEMREHADKIIGTNAPLP